MNTSFVLSAPGWSTASSALSYQFFRFDFALNTLLPLSSVQSSPSFALTLPPNPSHRLIVRVFDDDDAYTDSETTVRVDTPPVVDLSATRNRFNQLANSASRSGLSRFFFIYGLFHF
jgi:hypothetical protein